MCFSTENESSPVILIQIDGEAIAEVNNQNYLVWLLTVNWVGKIIYHLCVERSLVV